MAFGLPASFYQYIPFNTLSKSEFKQISIQCCKKLNWSIIIINEDEIIAETNPTLATWNETIKIDYHLDDPLITSTSNGKQIYDRARNKRNTETFFDAFNEFRKTTNTVVVEGEEVDHRTVSSDYVFEINKEADKTITAFYSPFSIIIPVKNYFITPILLLINVFLFFTMFFSGVRFFSPKTQDIISWGGNYGTLTTNGEWWRLVSSYFIHIGFLHLAANCFALAYVGLFLESHLKRIGFLSLYLFCGLFASLTSLYWNENLVSAGASGAIFGMYGLLLVFLATKTVQKKLNSNTIFFIIFFVTINLLGSFKEGIDGAAHVGGFVSGILFGAVFVLLKKHQNKALLLISCITFILAPTIGFYCKQKKIYLYDILEYRSGMQEFIDMEKMALEAYTVSSDENKADVLYMIKERGIYYWDENIILIKELDQLYLPKNIHDQNKELELYCTLRKKVYQLGYKKINENTSVYDSQIGSLNYKIEGLLKQIEKHQKE
jgi:rhomboid protease GluP